MKVRFESEEEAWDAYRKAEWALGRYYFAAVDQTARDVLADVREYDSDIQDAMWEHVDGSQWVIYTHRAQLVVAVSDNADAWNDEGFGELDPALRESQLAFAAMLADVREAIGELQDEEADVETDAA